DERGVIRWANPAFSRLVQRPAMALIGRQLESQLPLFEHGAHLDPALHPVRLALERGPGQRPILGSYALPRSGQDRILEVHVSCLEVAGEVSAMMVVRDLTERYLAEQLLEAEGQRLELIRSVAAASNLAEEPLGGIEVAIRLLCRHLNADVGHAYLAPAAANALDDPPMRSTDLWYCSDWKRYASFMNYTERAAEQDALVEEVLAQAEPLWFENLTAATDNRRRRAAEAGLTSAVAFPVRYQRRQRAVLEFFSVEPLPSGPELVSLFEQFSTQLSRIFERDQTRRSLLRTNEELERRVADRTAELMNLNEALLGEVGERARTQEALAEAMDRYQSVLQSMREVLFSVSASGRVESLNAAFEALTGHAAAPLIGRRAMSVIHPLDRRVMACALKRTLRGEEVDPFEVRLIHASGADVFVECRLTKQASKNGETARVTGIARDVTETRQARAQLVLNSRAMSATSEGIVITDARLPGNPVVYANPGFERLTGWTAAETVGRSLASLRSPETPPEAAARLDEAMQTGNPVTLEVQTMRKDGQSFWVRQALTPVTAEGGELSGFVAILSDITDQKNAEKMKTEFVSMVSHELRTPLTSLRGFAELMLDREYPPEKQKKFITIIHKESTRLANLINDFLDVQRMESGRQEYRFSRVPIGHILQDTAALFRPSSPQHQFEVVFEEGLGDVRADADRLRQVATNLVSNAVKYSPKGGLVRLEARLVPDGNAVQITIADSGLGIPQEALPRLFEKFYRVDNTETRKIGGTGLGLSIVRQIVDAHGGRIWVESKVGQGSQFHFTLPLFP
ncbi:MAG: PAS domain S-box protein, partial [Bryobacterales bacterium]|nr:PAS domain S-box protein [Bryobacterales bacterium]